MKKLLKLLVLLALSTCALVAQSSSGDEEDVVVLSAFEVSNEANAAYGSAAASAGSRSGSFIVDAQSEKAAPVVPITLVKRADAAVIQFAISSTAEKPAIRNQELYSSLLGIQAALAKVPRLRMEQREIRFTGGNRKFLSFGKGAQNSYANILIFAELAPEFRFADRVKQVRDLIDQIKFPAQVKLVDGSAGLYIKNISAYRREILQKIFDDLNFVQKGLGDEFEVLPSGLSQAVRMRACSETDIELWIDYSFSISSIRALTHPKN